MVNKGAGHVIFSAELSVCFVLCCRVLWWQVRILANLPIPATIFSLSLLIFQVSISGYLTKSPDTGRK